MDSQNSTNSHLYATLYEKRHLHGKILTLLNDNDQIGDHITMTAMSSHPIAHLKNQIVKLIIPWKTTVVG